jgi:hypothetical protein
MIMLRTLILKRFVNETVIRILTKTILFFPVSFNLWVFIKQVSSTMRNFIVCTVHLIII